MKILIVCSGNFEYTYDNFKRYQPFVYEQIKSLEKLNVEFEVFLIKGKGASGYLKNLKFLKQKVKSFKPDIIHAHYGFSGLLAILQIKVPVIVTFHGSDVQASILNRVTSNIVHFFANYSIFVSNKLIEKIVYKKKYQIIPCGINPNDYPIISKLSAREQMGYKEDDMLVLFSSGFDVPVKNYLLAKKAIEMFKGVHIIELKGYDRAQVATLMNAVDCLLLTSFNEGSPQVIKEALMCGCPIVSTDVGDVKELIEDVEGCYVVPYDENIIYEKIKLILQRNKRINGIEVLQKNELFNDVIAQKILDIYLNTVKD